MNRLKRVGLALALALVLPCFPASAFTAAKAEVWTGWVSWVMDDDTVLLVREGQKEPVKLRIEGIDAPEICQPGGPEARDAMIRLAFISLLLRRL